MYSIAAIKLKWSQEWCIWLRFLPLYCHLLPSILPSFLHPSFHPSFFPLFFFLLYSFSSLPTYLHSFFLLLFSLFPSYSPLFLDFFLPPSLLSSLSWSLTNFWVYWIFGEDFNIWVVFFELGLIQSCTTTQGAHVCTCTSYSALSF